MDSMSVTIKPKFSPEVEADIFDAAFEGKSRREEEADVMRAHLRERARDCLATANLNEALIARHRREESPWPGFFGLGLLGL